MANLSVSTGSCSHQGRRRGNEDAALVTELEDGRLVAAVADGMGGHAAGETASEMALDLLTAKLNAGSSLEDGLRGVNSEVYEAAQGYPALEGMGTTLVVVVTDGDMYTVGNVGDSRAYRIDEGGVQQITTDHSFVSEAVEKKELTEEEAAASRWRNALTRAVGTDPEVEPDIYGPFPVKSTHALLLCSDGLSKNVPDRLLHRFWTAAPSPSDAVDALVRLAYRRGSDDNITAVGVAFGEMNRSCDPITMPIPIPVEGPSDQDGKGPDARGLPAERRESSSARARLFGAIAIATGAVAIFGSLSFLDSSRHEAIPAPLDTTSTQGPDRADTSSADGGPVREGPLLDEPSPTREEVPDSGTGGAPLARDR